LSRDALATARWHLIARFTALIALLLVAGSVGVYAYVRHSLLGALDTTHALAIHSALESVRLGGAEPVVDGPEFQEEFEELNLTLGVVALTIWDSAGRELAHAAIHHEKLAASGPSREVRSDGEHMIIVRRQALGPAGDRGWIAVGLRASDVAEHLLLLRRGLLLMLPLGLLGALAVGWSMTSRALRPVRDTFEQQRAFMADVSHELRTPLVVIRAQAEVQLDAGDDTSGGRAALAQIATTAAQMGTLLDDLLFLSRADAAALLPRRLTFALDGLVEESVATLEPLARRQGSRLVFVAPPGEIAIEADPAQLQRLVTLLVDNALRHAGPVLVEVSVTRVGHEVQLCVDDGGPGIDPSLLPRIFERFVRGQATGSGGHGLGLAIARSIVLAHRGTIVLRRSHLGGTSAMVSLPARHSA
jgi:signal transduction histidine kinase